MLEDKRVDIEIYMVHDKIDMCHYNYNMDADFIVKTYTDWDELYPSKGPSPNLSDTCLHIEFITNEYSGVKRMEIDKWDRGHYLGHKRKYVKSNI